MTQAILAARADLRDRVLGGAWLTRGWALGRELGIEAGR